MGEAAACAACAVLVWAQEEAAWVKQCAQEEALAGYMFHIVVESKRSECYFTGNQRTRRVLLHRYLRQVLLHE